MKQFTILIALFLITTISAQDLDTIINVGNYNMHFIIKKGTKSPIIFESGSGNDATVWNDIIDSISKKTNATIITYDRVGYGNSHILSKDKNNKHGILNNVIALEKSLMKLGFNRNLTFVSHSLGGFYTRLFSSRNPKKVKQVVFLDASIPSFYTKNFMNRMNLIMSSDFINKVKQSSLGMYYELLNINETVELLRKIKFPKSIPVLSLEASVAFNPLNNENDALRWKQSHKEFTSKFSNRKSIEIEKTSHYIFKSKPQIIIKEIADYYNTK